MDRRRVLAVAGSVVTSTIAGCITPSGQTATDRPSTATPTETTDTGSSGTPTPVGTRGYPTVYFSEILPNPEGEDTDVLNEEYVLVEMNAEQRRDLSNFTLEYGRQHRYQFPDLVDTVTSGANLIVRSGDGDTRIEGTDYLLFAGSTTPLLDNAGMQLTLRDEDGGVVDSVRYGEMEEGRLWVRLE